MMKKLRRRFYLWRKERRDGATEDFSPHGVPVHVPATADISLRYLLTRGRDYEREEAAMVRDFLAPGMNVIELGGCMGIISALIRDRIGPEAKHVVVEANPGLVAICEANAARAAAPGATELVQPVVDYSGRDEVTFAFGETAHSGYVGAAGADGVAVRTITLAALAARVPDGPFALICDIEGAELDLFEREDPKVLGRISVLVLETHPKVYRGGAAEAEKLAARIEAGGLHLRHRDGQVMCFTRVAPA